MAILDFYCYVADEGPTCRNGRGMVQTPNPQQRFDAICTGVLVPHTGSKVCPRMNVLSKFKTLLFVISLKNSHDLEYRTWPGGEWAACRIVRPIFICQGYLVT